MTRPTNLNTTLRAACRGYALVRLAHAANELQLAANAVFGALDTKSALEALDIENSNAGEVDHDDVAIACEAMRLVREVGRFERILQLWANEARSDDDAAPLTMTDLVRDELAPTPRIPQA